MAGLRSHSLSLLSDAGHNFTDALALLLAAIGVYLQGKPANRSKTYGYGRAGVIAAFLNAATLIVVSLIIFWEAIGRIMHPEPLNDRIMMWVAVAALVLNGGIVVALTRGKKGDINIRAAVVHMAGDAVGAVAIILGALAIRFTGLTYIDPVLSIVLGIFIVYTATRYRIDEGDRSHGSCGRCAGYSRPSYLESWLEYTRSKLTRPDRRHACFGKRTDTKIHQWCLL